MKTLAPYKTIMNLFARYSWLFLLTFGINSCVDPIKFKTDTGEELMIIEGFITNEDGPYLVRISKTKAFTSSLYNPKVRNAVVVITDDAGNSAVLPEITEGVYGSDPNSFKGQVGRTYTLTVYTTDGQQYVSAPETMLPTPEIVSPGYSFINEPYVNENGVAVDAYYFNIYTGFDDPAAERNYYRWTWEGVYQKKTFPEKHTRLNPLTGVRDPDPLPCCAICWIEEPQASVNVRSDLNINGSQIRNNLVTKLPVTADRFFYKYQVKIAQYSLSEKGYEVWKAIQDQVEVSGGLYDKIPVNITGNISNPARPAEKVLGYFGASAVRRVNVFLPKSAIPFGFQNYPELPDDCRTIPNSTAQKPEDWED